MEPGDLGLCPGLAPHYLCDSKVKSANSVSPSSLLRKMELPWALPASRVQMGRRLGRVPDTQGPQTLTVLNSGQLNPCNTGADRP